MHLHHHNIACLQEKQKRSAAVFSSTPLADVTPRHSQTATPLELSKQYDRAMSASVLLTPAALAGQENVEEQCLSANRWLRGLAEVCVDNMYTPAKPQATNDVEDEPQVLHSASQFRTLNHAHQALSLLLTDESSY